MALALLAAAASPAAAGEKLRLGYLRSDLHHLAAWVGIEKGFFKEEGLDVETAGIFNAGAEEMSAFASKGIDVGYLGMAPSITGVANRAASVKAAALANAEGSAIVVRADSAGAPGEGPRRQDRRDPRLRERPGFPAAAGPGGRRPARRAR